MASVRCGIAKREIKAKRLLLTPGVAPEPPYSADSVSSPLLPVASATSTGAAGPTSRSLCVGECMGRERPCACEWSGRQRVSGEAGRKCRRVERVQQLEAGPSLCVG